MMAVADLPLQPSTPKLSMSDLLPEMQMILQSFVDAHDLSPKPGMTVREAAEVMIRREYLFKKSVADAKALLAHPALKN